MNKRYLSAMFGTGVAVANVMTENNRLSCPITYVIELISAKWTIELLREMALGPVRTRRFLARIPGLSMKSLRQRLQGMEDAGLISRTQFEGRPLRVEYSVTGRGKQLFDIFRAMESLGNEWLGGNCVCSFDTCESDGNRLIDCPYRRSDSRAARSASRPDDDTPS